MARLFTHPITLWVLFGLFVAETIGFAVIMQIWDFVLIDEMSDPEVIRQHIHELSDTQRMVHAWTTATLDVAYPLTYGALFAGLAFGTFRLFFAIPAIAVIPVDLAEGFVQVMVLTGNEQFLWLKAYLTPLKLLLFVMALLIAFCAVVVGIRRRRKPSL